MYATLSHCFHDVQVQVFEEPKRLVMRSLILQEQDRTTIGSQGVQEHNPSFALRLGIDSWHVDWHCASSSKGTNQSPTPILIRERT